MKDKFRKSEQLKNRQNFEVNGHLYLVRCMACQPFGKENWGPMVAKGICAWCGWQDDATQQNEEEPIIDALKQDEIQPNCL